MKPENSDYIFSNKPISVTKINTKYRKIQTSIPHPEDSKILQSISKNETSLLSKQLPIVWDKAEDFLIYDRWGNRWIDLSSTIFVANSGHANPESIKRIQKLLDRGLLHSYCYPTVERAELLDTLINITPNYLNKASLVSTGTEASERAIKLSRIYGMQFNPRKKAIIGGLGKLSW